MNSADYDVGFETGKEESRIIFENTVLPQRVKQAISANNKKWVAGVYKLISKYETDEEFLIIPIESLVAFAKDMGVER